jgi:curli production assembly/transport component CsgG
MKRALSATALCASVVLAGCTTPTVSEQPTTVTTDKIHEQLVDLPPAKTEPTVAVYRYPDKTGKHKPNDKYASYSRAVTQGAASVLVKALNDAGGGQWFDVVPRGNLQDVLKERKIVRRVRAKSNGESAPQLPSLAYADVILEGGIIGYDANTMTGGLGAKYLGIGGDTEYRKDTVFVYLRATSVADGTLLHSVKAKKTIYSYSLNASVFKFVTADELLEAEAGVTNNEPNLVALRKAVDEALYTMIVEGAQQGLWSFQTDAQQQRVIERFKERKRRERKRAEQIFAKERAEADGDDPNDPSPEI